MSNYDNWYHSDTTNDQLASTLSDYHKDVHGFRVQMHGASREDICKALANLDDYMDKMWSTPSGRASLEADGWSFEDNVKLEEV